MPEPASVPDQLTVKLGVLCNGGSGVTLLCGAVLSMPLIQIDVRMGGVRSTTMLALEPMRSPVTRLALGCTR